MIYASLLLIICKVASGEQNLPICGKLGWWGPKVSCFSEGQGSCHKIVHVTTAKTLIVGYTQGEKDNPSYDEVSSGTTGHTEALLVTFDPSVVTFERLVDLAMERLGENKYLLNQVGNDK